MCGREKVGQEPGPRIAKLPLGLRADNEGDERRGHADDGDRLGPVEPA
jgi:hypothetical protein